MSPEEVQRKLGVIQKLIEHSYYEYTFIDVALSQCFQTLELALHFKYLSHHPNKKGLKNLKPYLDWAWRTKYVSPNQKLIIELIRNHIEHPKGVSIIGMTGMKMIHMLVELSAGLFVTKQ
jgi:hypothetical protein